MGGIADATMSVGEVQELSLTALVGRLRHLQADFPPNAWRAEQVGLTWRELDSRLRGGVDRLPGDWKYTWRVTALTTDDVRKLRRVMGSIPYSGSSRFKPLQGLTTVDDVVEWLATLQVVLEEVAQTAQAVEQERQRLRRVIAGGRAMLNELLGTGQDKAG